ncbi:MAG: hypothetical protein RR626_03555 [Anaerovoracaceae bacterium]
MKNLVIIIGTILLGAIIVTTLVLGDGPNSLQGGATSIVSNGIKSIGQIK